MLSYRCPHCSGAFEVSTNAAGREMRCPFCERMMRIPDEEEAFVRPARRRPRRIAYSRCPPSKKFGSTFFIALLTVFGLTCGLCCLSSIFLPHSDRIAPITQREQTPAEKDPYSPDCAIVRAYLKRQYGDVEILSWGDRTIFRNDAVGDFVTLSARFRVKGNSDIKFGLFTIGAFNTVESASVTD